MQPKYPGTDVPHYSKYVQFDRVDPHVKETWHTVHWPRQSHSKDLEVYAYADVHVTHAWTVDLDTAYFEDASEAVQFALLFGVG